MALTPLPIRLFCDLVSPGNLNDLNRNSQPPSFYRGDDIEIDIGLGENGALLTSIANVASVTAQIFAAENDVNAPMMSCTTSAINTGLTQVQWTNGTAPFFHAAFIFPNSQTAITLGGAASVNYWLRVTAQTSDATPKNITILDGPITVKDGPVSAASAPPLAQFRIFTVAGQIVPQLLDTTTGLYHTLAIFNDGGVFTLQLSDQGY